MRFLRFFAVVQTALVLIIVAGCHNRRQPDLEEALSLYWQNRLDEALPLLENYVSSDQNDAGAHAWLAETYRRLGMRDEAVLSAFQALDIEPCNSFAHTIIADACHRKPGDMRFDSDTTWIHINEAVQCDSTNGNAWMFLCAEAMLREKFDLMQKSARKLIDTGFLTKTILAYGRWMMRTLPENAILITNGDMDTFPLLALQAAEGFRTDVAVAEKQWLGLKSYLDYLRDTRNTTLPLRDTQIDSLIESQPFPENMLSVADSIFAGWLQQKASGSLNRPVAIAVTVTQDFYNNVTDHFQYAGPYLLWQPKPVDDILDTLAVRKSIAGIRIEDFSGRWVSVQDYSPVRTIYTKELARNITEMALVYGEELINTKQYGRAEEILDWSENFEKTTELGLVSSDRISHLRSEIEKSQP